MEERRRLRVCRCSSRISRWRVRLFCFRAEAVRRDSLSMSRVSWERRFSRFEMRSWIWDSVLVSSSVGAGEMLGAEAKREYVWKRVSVYLHVSFKRHR